MAEYKKSTFKQLEDALLRVGPIGGAVIGGLAGAGMAQGFLPTYLEAAIGGGLGALVIYIPLMLVFKILNPSRDCSEQ